MPASWLFARLCSLVRSRGRNTIEFPPVEDANGLPFTPPDPSRLHDLKLDPYPEPLLQVILRPRAELAHGGIPATASFLRRLHPHLQPLDPIALPIYDDEIVRGETFDLEKGMLDLGGKDVDSAEDEHVVGATEDPAHPYQGATASTGLGRELRPVPRAVAQERHPRLS